MWSNNQGLMSDLNVKEIGTFQPYARYHHGMDCLYYITMDCAYRAERVDRFVTLLWHPKTDSLVGVKLKGFRFLFDIIRQKLKEEGKEMTESQWIPLVQAVETALNQDAGELINQIERKRKYDFAKKVTRQVALAPEDWEDVVQSDGERS
jgi:hypothetical protein